MPPMTSKEDNALDALVDARRYKEALHHVEKKLKKSARDQFYLVAKAEVLAKTLQREESVAICKDLCSFSAPKIVDKALLRRVYQLLVWHAQETSIYDEDLQILWKSAIISSKRNTSDMLGYTMEWIAIAIACHKWSHVRMAAKMINDEGMASSQVKRKYHMWQIFARFMEAVVSKDTDAKMSDINFRVADSLISQVGKTFPGPTLSSQENRLLVRIYETTNVDKILSLENGDWSIIDAKLLVLDRTERWHELWKSVKAILEAPNSTSASLVKDEWLLWKNLVNAEDQISRHLEYEDIAPSVTDATDVLLRDNYILNGKMRSPERAMLAFLVNKERRRGFIPDTITSDALSPDLLQTSQMYFRRYSSQRCCFNDLRDTVAGFDTEQWLKFRKQISLDVTEMRDRAHHADISERFWLAAEISMLKFDYMMTIARTHKPLGQASQGQDDDMCVVTQFIINCLELYRISGNHKMDLASTDTKPGDEAGILAALAIMRLFSRKSPETFRPFLILLLELILRDSPHNHSARALLTEVYAASGLASLAVRTYDDLKVKGILNETLAPLLFTQISLFQPLPCQQPQARDIYEMLRKSLEFFEETPSKVHEFQMLAMQNENYTKVEELDILNQNLERSSTKQMLLLECRRIERMRRMVYHQSGDTLQMDFNRISYANKSAAFQLINYESAESIPLRMNIPLCKSYLCLMHFVDQATVLLVSKGKVDLEAVSLLITRGQQIGQLADAKDHWKMIEDQYMSLLTLLQSLFTVSPGNLRVLQERLQNVATTIKEFSQSLFSRRMAEESVTITSCMVNAGSQDRLYLLLELLNTCRTAAGNMVEMEQLKKLPHKEFQKIKAGLKLIQTTAEAEFKETLALGQGFLAAIERLTPLQMRNQTFVAETSGFLNIIREMLGEHDVDRLFNSIHESMRELFRGIMLLKMA